MLTVLALLRREKLFLAITTGQHQPVDRGLVLIEGQGLPLEKGHTLLQPCSCVYLNPFTTRKPVGHLHLPCAVWYDPKSTRNGKPQAAEPHPRACNDTALSSAWRGRTQTFLSSSSLKQAQNNHTSWTWG